VSGFGYLLEQTQSDTKLRKQGRRYELDCATRARHNIKEAKPDSNLMKEGAEVDCESGPTDAPAKLLIEKDVITEAEFPAKIAEERATSRESSSQFVWMRRCWDGCDMIRTRCLIKAKSGLDPFSLLLAKHHPDPTA
jgi:hypothetical protein